MMLIFTFNASILSDKSISLFFHLLTNLRCDHKIPLVKIYTSELEIDLMRSAQRKKKNQHKQLDERLSYFVFRTRSFFQRFGSASRKNKTKLYKKTMGPKSQSHCLLWTHSWIGLDCFIFMLNSIEIECNFLWENDTEGQMLYYLLSKDNEAMQSIIISFMFFFAWSRHTQADTHRHFVLCALHWCAFQLRISRKFCCQLLTFAQLILPLCRLFDFTVSFSLLSFACFSINLIKMNFNSVIKQWATAFFVSFARVLSKFAEMMMVPGFVCFFDCYFCSQLMYFAFFVCVSHKKSWEWHNVHENFYSVKRMRESAHLNAF